MSEKNEKCESETCSEPEFEEKFPDGGWGWVIVAATGICNFINIPVMQSFALIFKNRIEQLNMSTTDLTTIINVNAAFGMGLGLITGPLLKKLGYRKVALFGAFSASLGITATSWATTFVDFLITYSIITSMGTFILMSAFQLAINTYFLERRGYASGMSTTLVGLGPVVMPHVITFLLQNYDTSGTTLILGGLSMHSILAALLLQPVKWHMKLVPVSPKENLEEDELSEEKKRKPATCEARRRIRTNTVNSVDQDIEFDSYSMYSGIETPLVTHRHFGSTQHVNRKRRTSTISFHRSISQNDETDAFVSKRSNVNHILQEICKSNDTVNLGSSVKIFDEKRYHQLPNGDSNDKENKFRAIDDRPTKVVIDDSKNNTYRCDVDDNISEDNRGCKNKLSACAGFFVDLFDLRLLTDPGYVILMVGMSLAICAELNFSLFTPLILGDYGFSLQQIATVMSVVASVDIVFRFLSPFVGDKLGFTAQTMYLLSLVLLITSRTTLMIFHEYYSAIAVGCGLGVAKGFRTVYMGLVIPSYVPLEKLPSASGIQSVVNCLCIVLSIPLMAAVRDKTGSFNMCIGALNCITFITVVMWTTQLVVQKFKKRTVLKSQTES